jgi:hypothetical protein
MINTDGKSSKKDFLHRANSKEDIGLPTIQIKFSKNSSNSTTPSQKS